MTTTNFIAAYMFRHYEQVTPDDKYTFLHWMVPIIRKEPTIECVELYKRWLDREDKSIYGYRTDEPIQWTEFPEECRVYIGVMRDLALTCFEAGMGD